MHFFAKDELVGSGGWNLVRWLTQRGLNWKIALVVFESCFSKLICVGTLYYEGQVASLWTEACVY